MCQVRTALNSAQTLMNRFAVSRDNRQTDKPLYSI
jgi:hypothetical protein